VLTGQTVWETRPEYGRTYGAAYSDRVRNECGVPTIAFGQITTVDEVNTLVAAGRADLCILDR
jgi:anthraniloyl-CoA monooxygenase